MATLYIWEPFRAPAGRNITPDQTIRRQRVQQHGRNRIAPAFDVSEDAENYYVQAALPGLKPEDLQISLENQVLTIRGEFKPREQPEGTRYHVREHMTGSFERSFHFRLPLAVEHVQANFTNGVLTLHLPKSDAIKPRRIAVQTSATPEAIEHTPAV